MLSDLSVEFFQNDSFESLPPYETKTTGLGLFLLEVYELRHHTASLNPLTFPISWTQITTAAGLAATQTTNQVLLVCNNYTSRIICIYIYIISLQLLRSDHPCRLARGRLSIPLEAVSHSITQT